MTSYTSNDDAALMHALHDAAERYSSNMHRDDDDARASLVDLFHSCSADALAILSMIDD